VPASVGLFVRPTDADIDAVLGAVKLDVLQVYDTATRCADIRARFGVKVWRAVGVAAPGDLPDAADGVDGFVIEAKPPEGATRPGGNALAFDWTVLAGWRAPLPWLLAGGLTPGNVAGAIGASAAAGVDVSSGVERAPGLKDAGMIRDFVTAARGVADQPCLRDMASRRDS
jgi:phosphoribosylanthranilate isomerase